MLVKFVHSIREGEDFFETYGDELEKEFEEERLAAELTRRLPPPSEEEAGAWRGKITATIDRLGDDFDESAEDEQFGEVLYGVYGFTLFQSYGLKETVTLPGEILYTNAATGPGNVLTWEFGSSEFRWQDYVLRARSRVIYPERIVVAGSLVVLLFALGVVGSRRRKIKRSRA